MTTLSSEATVQWWPKTVRSPTVEASDALEGEPVVEDAAVAERTVAPRATAKRAPERTSQRGPKVTRRWRSRVTASPRRRRR